MCLCYWRYTQSTQTMRSTFHIVQFNRLVFRHRTYNILLATHFLTRFCRSVLSADFKSISAIWPHHKPIDMPKTTEAAENGFLFTLSSGATGAQLSATARIDDCVHQFDHIRIGRHPHGGKTLNMVIRSASNTH